MKYVYILELAACLLVGGYIGYRLAPGESIRTVRGPEVEKEIIRTVTRTTPGQATVITEVKERVITKPSAPQASKPDYRVGLSLRPTQAELSEARVSIGRRLLGDLWCEAAYDLNHKEITLGISYEF